MMAEGFSNIEIGTQFEMRAHVVKGVLRSILKKLGARTRAEAVAAAVRRGLI
jgi:DNA-binding CsgD family transcriptional regulator